MNNPTPTVLPQLNPSTTNIRHQIKPDTNDVDRISNLPDALITLILTLMPSDDAIQAQLISKRWRYAWASIPSLTFSQQFLRKDYTPTDQLITNALMLHKGPLRSLSLLRADCRANNGEQPPIHLWVESAVNKRIEVFALSIDDDGPDGYQSSYFFPRAFYNCDSLIEFSLRAFKFDLGRSSVYWKSLKKLSLSFVKNLSNAKIDKIIESSPKLDSLNLSYCSGYNRIRVSPDGKLKNLAINENDVKGKFLEISGACIKSLEISGDLGGRHCRLGDVSSLVQVNFRFHMNSKVIGNRVYVNVAEEHNQVLNENSNLAKLIKCQRTLLQLLDKTSHVEILSLGNWCAQVLSLYELGSTPTLLLLSSLKCKTFEIDLLKERSVPGIAGLLRNSPYLENLTIHMHPYELEHWHCDEIDSGDFSGLKGENYWKSEDQVAAKNPWLHHLKVVEFIGSLDTTEKLVTELAEFVLGHAKVLENLVLNPGERVYRRFRHSDLRNSGLFYVIQKLFNYPRCSHQAKILLV